MKVESADGVGDPVCADLLGVVIENGHPGLDAGLEDHGVELEIALGHLPERRRQPGDDRGDGHAFHVPEQRHFPMSEEIVDQREMFVAGALVVGGDAPVVCQLVILVEADDGLGVADVDDKEH